MYGKNYIHYNNIESILTTIMLHVVSKSNLIIDCVAKDDDTIVEKSKWKQILQANEVNKLLYSIHHKEEHVQ